jgi:hypothetical protein
LLVYEIRNYLSSAPSSDKRQGSGRQLLRRPRCWRGKLKEREVWLNEYETIDDGRRGIGGYVDRYHHRPHSGLNYRTPTEVRRTWEDLQGLQKIAA